MRTFNLIIGPGIQFRRGMWFRREIRDSVVSEKTYGKFVKRSKAGLRQARNKFENKWRPEYKVEIPTSS
jgi:hypothetical protein